MNTKTGIRRPSETLLQTAERYVILLPENDPRIEIHKNEGMEILRQLTPRDDLDQQFPKSVSGTPYVFYSSSMDDCARAVFVHPDPESIREHLLYEVALGRLDNFCRL